MTEFSYLAEIAAKAHKGPLGKFKGFIVEGELRTGKTSYSIKAMRDIHMILNPGMSRDEAYEIALKCVNFKISPFLRLVRAKQKEIKNMLPKIDWTKRIPVLTLDDASLYAGVDLYFRSQKLYSAFQNTMTTIGTAVSALIITAPKHTSLARPLREFYDYNVVRITEYDEHRREAAIKEWYTTKTGGLRLRRIATDEFTAYIPNRYYAKYLKDRIELGEESVEELLAAVDGGTVTKTTADKVLEGLPDFKKLRDELKTIPNSKLPQSGS